MFRAVVLVAMLWSASAAAHDLPKNLLLKCEGKLTIVLSKPTPESLLPHKFQTILRLKDGRLTDTESMYLDTEDCVLRNEVVVCTGKAIYPSSIDGGSEGRRMKSYINRETGEYSFFMETEHFTGSNGTGKKAPGMKYHRSGVCRQISKPIF